MKYKIYGGVRMSSLFTYNVCPRNLFLKILSFSIGTKKKKKAKLLVLRLLYKYQKCYTLAINN